MGLLGRYYGDHLKSYYFYIVTSHMNFCPAGVFGVTVAVLKKYNCLNKIRQLGI